jgi:hypothetical protein
MIALLPKHLQGFTQYFFFGQFCYSHGVKVNGISIQTNV